MDGTTSISPFIIDNDKDSLEVNQSQCQNMDIQRDKKPIQKKRKLTSTVWEHFRLLDSKPGEELKCECKKCGAKYSADSKYGTGNLNRHIQKCMKMTSSEIGQYLLSSSPSGLSGRNPKFSQEKFRELLIQAIIRHDLPFSFVEYQGIRNVFKYLEPNVGHISRNTARMDIKKKHALEVNKLRNILNSCPSRICLTSDTWTSIVTDGYLSLTAHFIDNNWILQKRILNFSYMPPPHNGVSLAEKVYTLVADWVIERKLFSITLDNASANDVCATILRNQLKLKHALVQNGMFFHVRCCAHILNLIVQDGLKEIDEAVSKVRECAKYIKGSQVRKQKFSICVEQTSLDSKKALVQDVPTRWNSTYKMLSCAIYYRVAFCHMALSDSNFQSCPSFEEWERIEKICNFLEIFNRATNIFSGSYYPTANLYFPQVFLIQLKLVEECKSSDAFMRKIAEQMFVKFNKYWSEFNLLLAVAVVFDPRFKLQFVEFSYKKLYGLESVELKKVKDTLFSLYNEYLTAPKILGASPSGSKGSNEVHNNEISTEECGDVFKEFDQFDSFQYAPSIQKSQLEMYLDEPKSNRTSTIQVLDYWKSLEYRYSDLAMLARDILCVPDSTVASESAFSAGGRVLDQYRSSLSPNIVEALICCRDWMLGEKGFSTSIDDVIHDIMALNAHGGDSSESVKDKLESGEQGHSNVIHI